MTEQEQEQQEEQERQEEQKQKQIEQLTHNYIRDLTLVRGYSLEGILPIDEYVDMLIEGAKEEARLEAIDKEATKRDFKVLLYVGLIIGVVILFREFRGHHT